MRDRFSPSQLPPPADFQPFERLCLQLWKEIWGDPDAKRNGRQGQSQQGVDIFGRYRRSDNQWRGVQCKLKDINGPRKLTEMSMRRELVAASNFRSPIELLVIATTLPRDAKTQRIARNLSDESLLQGGPELDVWFWDDIVEELHQYPNLFLDYTGINLEVKRLALRVHNPDLNSRHILAIDKDNSNNNESTVRTEDKPKLGHRPFLRRVAEATEIDFIHERLSHYLDRSECPSLTLLKEFHLLNENVYLVVEKRSISTRQKVGLVACAIIYPIKRTRTNRIAIGVENADHIWQKDIYRGHHPAPGFYIGFIWGGNKIARGYLCDFILDRISASLEKETPWLFARPTTKEALLLMRNSGFRRCLGNGDLIGLYDVCKVQISKDGILKT